MTLSDSEIKGSIPCGLERTSKMKVYINNSLHSTTGYELVIKDDDGLIVETKDIETLVDDGKTLKLPENPSNRKYFNLAKVEAADGIVELTYKESVTLGTRSWMSYLTKEELENLEMAEQTLEDMRTEYKRNATARRENEKNVPLSPKEKLQREVARLQAKIARMESEEA